MKLYPVDEKISLYQEGFGSNDPLNRKPTGEQLSLLLEKIEDPLVVSLEGPWGSGKTHFLRRWVGAHTLENRGKANTVYFDAFANDFLDDPLTSLARDITARIPTSDSKMERAKKTLKGAAALISKPALRAVLAVATAGVTEVGGVLVDAAVNAGGTEAEKAIDEFWKRESGKKAAMDLIHTALAELTPPDSSGVHQKLIVVVDELDRCRPDYALSVLEVIKHFFSVENVHFVLGVNIRALEHSVAARYGHNFEAEAYLRRFISLSISLPSHAQGHNPVSVTRKYFNSSATSMELPRHLIESVSVILGIPGISETATIRDINKILSLLALLPLKRQLMWGWQETLCTLVVMKALNPELYLRVRRNSATLKDVLRFLQLDGFVGSTDATRSDLDRASYSQILLLTYLLNPSDENTPDWVKQSFDNFHDRIEVGLPGRIARDYLEVFSLHQG